MSRSRIACLLAFGAVLWLCDPGPAAGQNNKVNAKKPMDTRATRKDTVALPKPYEEDVRYAEQRFAGSVMELSATNLDRLQSALLAEQEYRDSVALFYAAALTPEARQQCRARVLASPKGQKLARGDTSTVEGAGNLARKREGLVEQECGPEHWRRARSAALGRARLEAARATKLSADQYSIMKSRSRAFCGGGDRPTLGPRGSLYVYSVTEIAAVPSRCEDLLALMKQLREEEARER